MSDESVHVTIFDTQEDPVHVTVTDPAESPVKTTVGDTNVVVTNTLIQNHREESTPHTAYDDMTSLTLLFENGLL